MSEIKEVLPNDLGYHAGLMEKETHCPAVIPSFKTEGEFDQWCVGYCDGLGVELVPYHRNAVVLARAYVLNKNKIDDPFRIEVKAGVFETVEVIGVRNTKYSMKIDTDGYVKGVVKNA